LSEAYRVALGVDAGAGPRRFTLFFVPPKVKTRDHPMMEPILCEGEPASLAECRAPAGAEAHYFGADQPRITAEARFPWPALGVSAPPATLRLDVASTAWHRSRWMSLTGAPPLSPPAAWLAARLQEKKPRITLEKAMRDSGDKLQQPAGTATDKRGAQEKVPADHAERSRAAGEGGGG
jgi:hypothetical protein